MEQAEKERTLRVQLANFYYRRAADCRGMELISKRLQTIEGEIAQLEMELATLGKTASPPSA